MSDTVNIFITGDFAPTYRVLDLIQSGEYQLMYNDILPVIRKADIAITNLEVPLIEAGTPIKKTGPNLKAPIKSVEALRFAGFNMVTLANNHIMDFGWEGLRSTMEICKMHDIKYIGAGKDLSEAQAIRYIEFNDSVIAFVNITENEWSTTQGDEPGANPLNEIRQYYQVSEAKRNSNYVILIIHGGHEAYGLPSPRMKKLYRYFIDIGADAVIGHHTHCYSGHEVYNGMPIIYSLGNFIFDSRNFRNDSEWNRGCAVMLKFQNDKVDFELVPYRQCDKTVGVSLLNFNERKAFLEEAENKSLLIQDDKKLAIHFEKFVQSQAQLYFSFLEPIKNRFLLAAMNRGILPRLINSTQKRLLLNLIRSEAHRNILLDLLGLKNK